MVGLVGMVGVGVKLPRGLGASRCKYSGIKHAT